MAGGRARTPLWLAQPTRFAALSRQGARTVLIVIALLIAATLAACYVGGTSPSVEGKSGSETDAMLYQTIVEGIRHGGHYYAVAATALREGGYPLKPFVAFRLPTLAVVEAALPPIVALALLVAIVVAAAMAWYVRLRAQTSVRNGAQIAVLVLLAAGLAVFLERDMVAFHEIVAGPLIALSLAVWRPGRWVEAAAIATIALMIRETVAAYLMVMLLFALLDRNWREAAGWGTGLAAFALVLVLHARAVAEVVGPLDPSSPGWHGLLGYGYFIKTVALGTLLVTAPLWIAAPLIALALVGWAAWRDALALRVLAVLAAYGVLLGVFARPDNVYWVLLIAPFVLLGLLFAPDALGDLFHRALDRRRITVTRMVR